jgi:NOL1/NOP2/fmu family ribosome biogenesis protein
VPIINLTNAVFYSLSGEDAAIFQINSATGEVSYQNWFTPSFAEVWDFDRDYIYEVSVIGSDGTGVEVGRAGLELVVSETDAVWRTADGGGAVDPVDPVDPSGVILYSLSGLDASMFQIDAATGEVSYQSWFTPSYAEVWDHDRDHIYEINIIGSDSSGAEVSRTGLELVVTETDAIWRTVEGTVPVEPVDPVFPVEPVEPVDPNGAVAYSLTGDDASVFQINAATGAVSYQNWFTPSYTEVWDLDRDHTYEISVVGVDSTGVEVSRTGLQLVVSETGAVWQMADGGAPVDPTDPVGPPDPVDPNGAITYALDGEDASIFQVNAATGEVSYQNWFTPSYAEVWDYDRDHIYEISVIGTDGTGAEVSRNWLELVVTETDAVWRNTQTSSPVDPVEPVDPVNPTTLVQPVVDIVRLDSDPSETAYGIRDDTSSRGVDLAGAVIVATFADGSVETLIWDALDPYTLGGATGTDITMAYGWSEHELTVTKQLASLQIDLKPASSVFDTTDTLDDDPLGGSTLGSSFGYAFKFVGDYADLGGAVTVTYSGIVNLVGSPAAGDLYTTMFVDFSALSGGGILGDVTWNSDIDTLRYQGDLVQAGTSDLRAGNDTVTGTASADFLNGSGGEDILIGLAGNDILNGGAAADEFVFADGSGQDLIVDFDISGGDTLNIQAFGFADHDAVMAVTTDVGANAHIQLDSDDSLTLYGISTSDLDASDIWLLTL